MGYRIEYGPMPKNVGQAKKGLLRLHGLTALFLLLFVLGVKQAWPEGTEVLRQFLLPGELTMTEQAADTLILDLREGTPFGDAITVFCRQIIENGQTVD